MTDVRFAEFVLRFASDPEGVRAWAGGEFDAFVRRAIENPIALRAARFVVFVCVDDDAPGQTYGGWLWE
jgi:hypothetical protein